VVGHVPAALDAEDLNPDLIEEFGRGENMFLPRAPTEREHGRMFEQQKRVVQLTAFPRVDHAVLKIQRFRVRKGVKVDEPDGGHCRLQISDFRLKFEI
jgi:hypothetical protein